MVDIQSACYVSITCKREYVWTCSEQPNINKFMDPEMHFMDLGNTHTHTSLGTSMYFTL